MFHRVHSSVRPHPVRAFTLIEMLVVIAIIVVIATIVVPATGGMLRGSQLTQSAQNLTDQLSFARQRALSKSRPVEVRFYQYADASNGEQANSTTGGKYRALQLFDITDTGAAVPLGKVQRMLQTVIIDSGSTLSSILNQGGRPALAGTSPSLNLPLPEINLNYNAAVFRFRSDGSTDLTATLKWFLTLHTVNSGDNLSNAPANFFTLQIDPANGSIRTFRP